MNVALATHIPATDSHGKRHRLAALTTTGTAGVIPAEAVLPAADPAADALTRLLSIVPGSSAWNRLSIGDKATIAQYKMQLRGMDNNPLARRCRSIVKRPKTGYGLYTVAYDPDQDRVVCECEARDCYHAEVFRREWMPQVIEFLFGAYTPVAGDDLMNVEGDF